MLTNSKKEMGDFKNNFIIKCLGWFSVIALTYLNLIGLPDQIANFIPHNLGLSHLISGFGSSLFINLDNRRTLSRK